MRVNLENMATSAKVNTCVSKEMSNCSHFLSLSTLVLIK